jgi:hypothetical protein
MTFFETVWTYVFLACANWVCSYDPPDEVVAAMVYVAPKNVCVLCEQERAEKLNDALHRLLEPRGPVKFIDLKKLQDEGTFTKKDIEAWQKWKDRQDR